jgi:hypothetical protein
MKGRKKIGQEALRKERETYIDKLRRLRPKKLVFLGQEFIII